MTVIGSSGALGNALTIQLAANNPQAIIHAAARKKIAYDQPNITHVPIHYGEEESISKAAKLCCSQLAPDLVIVATGILHTNSIMPEKSLDALSASFSSGSMWWLLPEFCFVWLYRHRWSLL